MNAEDITLNIAVNLGRLSRWAQEGKKARINQFLIETQEYIDKLDNTKVKPKFKKTLDTFKTNFTRLKRCSDYDYDWAEQVLTWANILTHRAKLA